MLIQLVEAGESPRSHAPEGLAIGIDLGTTNSVVAFSKNQQPIVLKNSLEQTLMPSVVAYGEEDTMYVGKDAEDLIASHPDWVITSIKRWMGKADTRESITRLHINGRTKTPIEISAEILKTLKHQAEQRLGHSITQAVITVPAYFDEAARLATKEAARLAGLNTLRLINEPTAAALAYGLDHGVEGIYAVYDLGGGTFDISLLRLTKGVFQVLATGGDTALGGDDIDHAIVTHFQDQFGPLSDTESKQTLRTARQIKEYLSTHDQGTWSIAGIKDCAFDQDTLTQLSMPFVKRTLDICRRVLSDADFNPTDIQGVILVGGSTRMPLIRQQVGHFFEQLPLTNLNPDEVVALGASLQAEALTQGSDTLLLDVTPLSLGIETMGGLVEKIIPRNTPIPAHRQQEFTTYQDNQTAMKIHVLQGERERVEHCRSLGEFDLKGIPLMHAGSARIMVTFIIDADGLLTVTAQEKATGIQQTVEVKPAYGLSEEDLQRILLENAHYGAQDITERLQIEARLQGEHLLQALEKAL